jgi:hypothetical protein
MNGSDLFTNVSLQRDMVATIIHIQSLRSQIHNIEKLVGQKNTEDLGQQWKQRAKEIFPRAILGTRAIGSAALFEDIIIK